MKRRLLALVLACVLVLSCPVVLRAHAEEQSGTCGENLTWRYDAGTKTLTIAGTGAMQEYKSWCDTPWSDFYPDHIVIEEGVTALSSGCFDWYIFQDIYIPASLTQFNNLLLDSGFSTFIVAPDNPVYTAYDGMLYSKDMKTLLRCPTHYVGVVSVPDGVTRIGEAAFHCCDGITSIALPDSVTSMGPCAFAWTSIETLKIPPKVTVLEDGLFFGAGGLQRITIPETVKEIQDNVFTYAGSMESEEAMIFRVPASVKKIGSNPFGTNCTSIVYILNPYCELDPDFWGNTIYGYDGSTAEQHAIREEYDEETGETFTINWYTFHSLGPAPLFADVANDAYYYEAVKWAVENGITKGTDDCYFSPKNTCTRAQIVTFLWAACGSPEPTAADNPFTDVPAGKWFTKPVLWAVENGITSGVNATTFGVQKACTREQAMTFLWKACGSPEPTGTNNPFMDVETGKWYYKAVLWAVESGITKGTSATAFGVGKPCTRAQIVTFLYKALKDKPLTPAN